MSLEEPKLFSSHFLSTPTNFFFFFPPLFILKLMRAQSCVCVCVSAAGSLPVLLYPKCTTRKQTGAGENDSDVSPTEPRANPSPSPAHHPLPPGIRSHSGRNERLPLPADNTTGVRPRVPCASFTPPPDHRHAAQVSSSTAGGRKYSVSEVRKHRLRPSAAQREAEGGGGVER